MSKLQLYLISFSLITSSFVHSASENEIDESMYQAFLLITQKDFISSNAAYLDILKHEDDMNLSQLSNIYNSLLELSFILDNKDDANKYGNKLISIIKDEPDYVKAYERLKYRICSSQDWTKFQYIFVEHCD
ncbi:hypothetical protein AADZ84_10985 [Colwelliaceae bacterium MEBiC 14330]